MKQKKKEIMPKIKYQYSNFSFFILFFISFNLFGNENTIKSSYQLKNYIQTIKSKELMHSLRMIVYKGEPNRYFGTKGHKEVQDLLEKTLISYKKEDSVSFNIQKFKIDEEAGKRFYQDDFDTKIVPTYKKDSKEFKKWESFKNYMISKVEEKKLVEAKNFIWEKKGEIDKTLILTAHYDTVSHDDNLRINESDSMPGADYNASSVAILLSLVKLIHPLKLKYNIRVVFLDVQSLAFLGSKAYAESITSEKENILGVINLEMLGHDSKIFDSKKKLYNFKAYMRDEKNDAEALDFKFYEQFSKLTKKLGTIMKFEVDKNNFNNSDNFRFWDIGLACITLTQNWEDDFNKKYQTKNDFPETINQQSLYYAYKNIALSTLGQILDFNH